MNTAQIILEQLGGNKFIAMTGAKNFVSDGDTLRMTLPRNGSKANRLNITLAPDDTYTMHFFKFSAGGLRVNHKKGTADFVEPKIEEVAIYNGIYCNQLEELFTEVTKLYTRLYNGVHIGKGYSYDN